MKPVTFQYYKIHSRPFIEDEKLTKEELQELYEMLGEKGLEANGRFLQRIRIGHFLSKAPPVSKVAPDVWNYLRINSSFQNKKVNKTKKTVKIS
jgi:hypothetical protein